MIKIEPIKSHHIEAVKQVIYTVCQEIWQVSQDVIRDYDDLSDIDRFQSHYLDNNGTFLLLIDDEKVVGSGGIRHLSEEICELKRMWFLKEYRGQGWGGKMSQMLLNFAKEAGYQKIRLDLANEQKQAPALKLYQKLGFYAIARYNNSPCTVFMEKNL